MKLNKYLLGAALCSTMMLTGCYDLDLVPDDSLSSSSVGKTDEQLKMITVPIYSNLQSNYVFGWRFGWDCLGGISMGYDDSSYQKVQRNTITVTAGAEVGYRWQQLYEGIARANNLIQTLDNAEVSDEIKERYRAEAKFLRAVHYFTLVNWFGGVPVYDETTYVAIDYAEMLKPRSSEAEVYDFILKDLDAALALPQSWDKDNNGRATWSAAMSLKGKVLLYNKRYQEASECFKKVIDSGLHELYPDYAGLFKPGGDASSEMIFAIQNIGGVGKDYGMELAKRLGTRSTYGSCWNNVMAANQFVEEYEWNDGYPFDWEDEFPGYSKTNNSGRAIRTAIWCSKLNSANNEVVSYPEYKDWLLEMYDLRDPRMKASLILPYTTYNGWQSNKPRTFEYVIANVMPADDTKGLLRVNTNYGCFLWRKFVPEANMDGALNNRDDVPINFPIIRYADVLLMQAECLNELGDQTGAVALINQVRGRQSVDMPGLNSGPAWLKATTRDEVFERIVHERRVELACEGHSYYDRRRWGTLEELNGWRERPITLNNTSGTGTRNIYTREVLPRNYYLPIPSTEIDKNPALEQNEGW